VFTGGISVGFQNKEPFPKRPSKKLVTDICVFCELGPKLLYIIKKRLAFL
jgi:hypothetical protein